MEHTHTHTLSPHSKTKPNKQIQGADPAAGMHGAEPDLWQKQETWLTELIVRRHTKFNTMNTQSIFNLQLTRK